MSENFHVIAEATLWRFRTPEHETKRELMEVGFTYPVTKVSVVDGPEMIEQNIPTEVTLQVPVTGWVGPGTINVGDVYWVGSDTVSLGSVRIKRVVPVGMEIRDLEAWLKFTAQVLDAHLLEGDEVVCPTCERRFSIHDRWRWTGVRHRTCDQRINIVELDNQTEPIWCLVGNIVRERSYGVGGAETRIGTKYFSPGTKVYCFPPLWGDGYENIKVVGLARRPREYITIIIRSAWVTNRRAKLIYKPELVDRLSGYWDGTQRSKQLAKALAR